MGNIDPKTGQLKVNWQNQRVCSHKGKQRLARTIARNGKPLVVMTCQACNKRLSQWLPFSAVDVDIEQLPLLENLRFGKCSACGEAGIEEHHYAPSFVFWHHPRVSEREESDDAICGLSWDYGTVDLCVKCHKEWHSIFNARKRPDEHSEYVGWCLEFWDVPRTGDCQCCGTTTEVDRHLVAPPDIFGIELAHKYKWVMLCRRCHALWHSIVDAWLDEAA